MGGVEAELGLGIDDGNKMSTAASTHQYFVVKQERA